MPWPFEIGVASHGKSKTPKTENLCNEFFDLLKEIGKRLVENRTAHAPGVEPLANVGKFVHLTNDTKCLGQKVWVGHPAVAERAALLA